VPKNNYLFNGKGLDSDLRLNWYHYGARFYDPATGRWNGVDPLAEQYHNLSPYVYVANNPMKYTDLNYEEQYIFQTISFYASIFPVIYHFITY
jgi:RHS repeat-associated protein